VIVLETGAQSVSAGFPIASNVFTPLVRVTNVVQTPLSGVSVVIVVLFTLIVTEATHAHAVPVN
jgi:hypothetical protein